MPVAWAAGIAAVGSIGGALISSSAASSASDKQIAAQQQAMDQATAERKRTFDIGEGYLKPYASLGSETLPTLKSLLGLGPEGADGMMSTLEKYPGYQFALDQGNKGVANYAIGNSSKYGGNALKAAADYNRNMGAGLFSDYYNKVLGITNQGGNASTSLANLAAGVGSGNAASFQSGNGAIGDAGAAGTIGGSNSWTNAIDQSIGAASKVDWKSVFGSGTPSASSVGTLSTSMPMVGPGSGIGSMASGYVW